MKQFSWLFLFFVLLPQFSCQTSSANIKNFSKEICECVQPLVKANEELMEFAEKKMHQDIITNKMKAMAKISKNVLGCIEKTKRSQKYESELHREELIKELLETCQDGYQIMNREQLF